MRAQIMCVMLALLALAAAFEITDNRKAINALAEDHRVLKCVVFDLKAEIERGNR